MCSLKFAKEIVMKSGILAVIGLVLFVSVSFGEMVLVPDSTKLTDSIIRDDFTIGGGVQNYVTFNDDGSSYEWAHIWFEVNTPYELSPASWSFAMLDSSRWVAVLNFNGVEVKDNEKFGCYAPATAVNGLTINGGVLTTCEYGDPLWANLNGSLEIMPNMEATDCSLQFAEYEDPYLPGVTKFNGAFIAWGNTVSVPEPGTIVLLTVAIVAIACFFRKL